jgi:hypothetical protein
MLEDDSKLEEQDRMVSYIMTIMYSHVLHTLLASKCGDESPSHRIRRRRS